MQIADQGHLGIGIDPSGGGAVLVFGMFLRKGISRGALITKISLERFQLCLPERISGNHEL